MKMMMTKRWLTGVAAAMLWGLAVAAPPLAANEHWITGWVCNAGGEPLPYANVVVLGTKLGAIGGEDGSFVIPHVPAGTYTVRCSYVSFQPSTELLKIGSCGAQTVSFVLQIAPSHKPVMHECGVVSGRIALVEKHAPKQVKQVAAPRFALAQNRPNPCNPATEIAFELAHRTRARLRIYDPAGRLVRFLVDETLNPGPQAILWDGRNDRGRAVSSGVYVYRLEAADFVETRQLVVLK